MRRNAKLQPTAGISHAFHTDADHTSFSVCEQEHAWASPGYPMELSASTSAPSQLSSPAAPLFPTPTPASRPQVGRQRPPCLTFDGDVSEETLLLPAASSLSLAHVMALILQLYGEHGEVQDPAVGPLLEGELAVQGDGVLVHAPAVQLSGPALLARQGPRVQPVPPQTLVGVVVSLAAQGHLLLLLVLRGLHVHAEALRDGFEGTKTGTKFTQTETPPQNHAGYVFQPDSKAYLNAYWS